MSNDGRLDARFGYVFRDPTDGETVMVLCPYRDRSVMNVLVIVPSVRNFGRYLAGAVTTEPRSRLARWERMA